MNVTQVVKDTEARMEKALDVLRNNLKGLRTGRASPQMLDSVKADYYGSPTPISQIANISCPDPASIMIKPFTADDLKEIEKAIRSSDLGLAPNNDGKVIRLNIPPMSGDARKKLVTTVKKTTEDQKVSCRNIRRDVNKEIETAEKEKKISEDDRDKAKTKIQDLLKLYEAKLDDIAEKKSKEIMES
ncbi:MAG: ribosome recycling factor [Fimbriiglobus sp.]